MPTRRRTRALFVTDPGTRADLTRWALAFLHRGADAAEYRPDSEDVGAADAQLTMAVADREVDLVVVLRSQPAPSRRVLEAIRACRLHAKPVHALVLRNIAPAVEVDEAHMIALDLRWESLQELYAWGDSLTERFGKPV